MACTSAIGNLFCQFRLLLLLTVGLTIVGWASLYVRGGFSPKYKTPDPFCKCPKPEQEAREKAPPPMEERTAPEEKICPAFSPKLQGTIPLSFNSSLTLEDLTKKYPNLDNGRYRPKHCKAQQRVAILIPHRSREKHLLYLLDNLHPFLQRQQLDYGIYVIHQAGDVIFNRGKLLNVGYLEALKEGDWDCFILHDVDLIPENDFNIYLCDTEPKHLVVGRNVTGYKLHYKGYFGGVTAMTRNQFAAVNGYSNNYWGWGGEDDDLRFRVGFRKMEVVRPPLEIARYTMIFHKADPGNKVNSRRVKLLQSASKTWKGDGLNSCTYKLLSVEHKPLYTNITVDLGQPPY
ncbi:beta-1,4-galactosyltransferase 4 [Gastrophryne carolinensis]